jgi:hypothetical protein
MFRFQKMILKPINAMYSLHPKINNFLEIQTGRLRTLAKDACTLISFPFLEDISCIWQLSLACTCD